ncbi:hypothetical protein CYME_CMP105C [Cyanidioschyzon merolae strain 10D]|uniref:Uncharacterized protein n=1 Tax=Cyanidioschyzon merolae (strain NIES-3377 / 10D) TaxID=280699 RepID=M1V639_CYAM1|nr:hypothetical protein CYME_CMP105C [Cyanidioschyzon merolae strain 10D]BAM81750.1 hypothetical protein CYME_CMP105C [Cyanidioschyzon merolae strain 10D]|eukprot:XP_005537786.1 hypothetical protein CYME_CMP105C [Cyanidioschyzon merolae strain 10D]
MGELAWLHQSLGLLGAGERAANPGSLATTSERLRVFQPAKQSLGAEFTISKNAATRNGFLCSFLGGIRTWRFCENALPCRWRLTLKSEHRRKDLLSVFAFREPYFVRKLNEQAPKRTVHKRIKLQTKLLSGEKFSETDSYARKRRAMVTIQRHGCAKKARTAACCRAVSIPSGDPFPGETRASTASMLYTNARVEAQRATIAMIVTNPSGASVSPSNRKALANIIPLLFFLIISAALLVVASANVSLFHEASQKFLSIASQALRYFANAGTRVAREFRAQVGTLSRNLVKSGTFAGDRVRHVRGTQPELSSRTQSAFWTRDPSSEAEPQHTAALVIRVFGNLLLLLRLQLLYLAARANAFMGYSREQANKTLKMTSAQLETALRRIHTEHASETAAVASGVATAWAQFQRRLAALGRPDDEVITEDPQLSWETYQEEFERKLEEICKRNFSEFEQKLKSERLDIEAILCKYASLSKLTEQPTEEAERAMRLATPEQRRAFMEAAVEDLASARKALAPFLEGILDPSNPDAEFSIREAEKRGITSLRGRPLDENLRRELSQLFTGGYDWDGELYTAETEGAKLWKAAVERLKKREDVVFRLQQSIQDMRAASTTQVPIDANTRDWSASARSISDTKPPVLENDKTTGTIAPKPLADELKLIREQLSVMSDEELVTWIRTNVRDVVRSGLAEKVLGRLALAVIAAYIFVNLVIKNDIVQQLELVRPYAERIVRFFIL